jgi:hypothetical protein
MYVWLLLLIRASGGNVDEGEAIELAASRELSEEFLEPAHLSLPKDAVIRPFVTKQTRPIRSRSNLMHNFVALEAENSWLAQEDLVKVIALEHLHQRLLCLAPFEVSVGVC